MMNNRHWYSLELNKEKASIFKEYLRKHNILYEPSECFNLIHFQCFMTMDEVSAANEYLDNLN